MSPITVSPMYLQGNLEGIQHLGLPVTNLERSRDFYLNFGFVEVMRTDLPPKAAPVRVAMVQKDNLTIELYQPAGAERAEIAMRGDGHIDHLALNVLDIDSAYTELKAAGFEILEKDAPVFLPFWSHIAAALVLEAPVSTRRTQSPKQPLTKAFLGIVVFLPQVQDF